MKYKLKNLSVDQNTLNSNELKQVTGGYKRRPQQPKSAPLDTTLQNLVNSYVPETPPPGTVFIYGSYYPIG